MESASPNMNNILPLVYGQIKTFPFPLGIPYSSSTIQASDFQYQSFTKEEVCMQTNISRICLCGCLNIHLLFLNPLIEVEFLFFINYTRIPLVLDPINGDK